MEATGFRSVVRTGTGKYDKLGRYFQGILQEEKQKIVKANKAFADKLQRRLASASLKLKQEQTRHEKMGADGQALVYEFRRQLEANNKENALTEIRLVQYGWDLQSRLDEQKTKTRDKMGKFQDKKPYSVETEKKKLVEALFPVPIHRSQVNNLPLETITSMAD